MTLRIFNSFVRNGYRKLPGSFVTRQRQDTILSKESLFYYFSLVIRTHIFMILQRIRLGTFNVNGKLPTQDLGSWVRGSGPNADKLIQPLKISETTPGESDSKEGEYLHQA